MRRCLLVVSWALDPSRHRQAIIGVWGTHCCDRDAGELRMSDDSALCETSTPWAKQFSKDSSCLAAALDGPAHREVIASFVEHPLRLFREGDVAHVVQRGVSGSPPRNSRPVHPAGASASAVRRGGLVGLWHCAPSVPLHCGGLHGGVLHFRRYRYPLPVYSRDVPCWRKIGIVISVSDLFLFAVGRVPQPSSRTHTWM